MDQPDTTCEDPSACPRTDARSEASPSPPLQLCLQITPFLFHQLLPCKTVFSNNYRSCCVCVLREYRLFFFASVWSPVLGRVSFFQSCPSAGRGKLVHTKSTHVSSSSAPGSPTGSAPTQPRRRKRFGSRGLQWSSIAQIGQKQAPALGAAGYLARLEFASCLVRKSGDNIPEGRQRLIDSTAFFEPVASGSGRACSLRASQVDKADFSGLLTQRLFRPFVQSHLVVYDLQNCMSSR